MMFLQVSLILSEIFNIQSTENTYKNPFSNARKIKIQQRQQQKATTTQYLVGRLENSHQSASL